MKNLVYLSYGAGLHEQEISFSVLSAYRWLGTNRPDWRIVIYTDRPEVFLPLEVATVELDPHKLREWIGPAGFGHRCKILALCNALQRFEGQSVLLDGDTFFRRSPQRLFDRLGPGRTVMHLREGVVGALPGPAHDKLRALLASSGPFNDLAGNEVLISGTTPMWNSGVIGVDRSDRALLDEALHLTDQFCSLSDLFTLEQFALGIVLGRRTTLAETGDVVCHYWDWFFRGPFREQLPQLLDRHRELSLEQRARRCYAYRPGPTLFHRAKIDYRRLLRALGLRPPVAKATWR